MDQESRARLHDEVVGLTRALVRIDSSRGGETACAELLRDHLTAAGVACELVARDSSRANLVARLPGSGSAPSLGFTGHTDVVPADAADWRHPPYDAVLDAEGYLHGRGTTDMKNEVAARAVALAELARTGFRPTGDLLLLAVADEEDGSADVGMRWLLEERPDVRPDRAVNEGGGERMTLADGRSVVTVSVGQKGTAPFRLVAHGQDGHASRPSRGRSAVLVLAELLTRLGDGVPAPAHTEVVDAIASVVVGRVDDDPSALADAVAAQHPSLGHLVRSLMGTTLAPTMLTGSAQRNVMPSRAWAEVDCRVLPGTTRSDVVAQVRSLLGDDLAYDLEDDGMVAGNVSPVDDPLPRAIAAWLAEQGDDVVLPIVSAGFTDSVHLRAAGASAYGFCPFRHTPAPVLESGYHGVDERIHVDDLLLQVELHLDLARRLLS